MTVTLRDRQRGRERETEKEKWEIGVEDVCKKQSIMGAGTARMHMEHVIECREEFAFGNQVWVFLLTSVIIIILLLFF